MLHVIKVGSQIQIDDFGLLFNDCLCCPVDRFMCRSFRSVSVRSRLEVRFEDRFQNELECSLDHAITDGRDREHSDFAPVLGYFLLPHPHGSIRVVDQFVSDLLQKTLRSALFDDFERDPVDSRCPVILLRHLIGFLKCFHFCRHGRTVPRNAWLVRPSPCRIGSYSGPATCWVSLSYHPCLPFLFEPLQTAGFPLSTGITPLH